MFHEYMMLTAGDTSTTGWLAGAGVGIVSSDDDGTWAARGQPNSGANGIVFVGTKAGDSGVTINPPTPPTFSGWTVTTASGQFGRSVDINKAGNVLLVGSSWKYDGTGANLGKKVMLFGAYVYTRSGSVWSLAHTFTSTLSTWRFPGCISGDGLVIAVFKLTVTQPGTDYDDYSVDLAEAEVHENVAGTWTFRSSLPSTPYYKPQDSSYFLRSDETGSRLFLRDSNSINVVNRAGNTWGVSYTIYPAASSVQNFGGQMVCSDDGNRLFVRYTRSLSGTDYERPLYFSIFDWSDPNWVEVVEAQATGEVSWCGGFFNNAGVNSNPIKIACSGDGAILWIGADGFDTPMLKYDIGGSPFVIESLRILSGPATAPSQIHTASSVYSQSDCDCTNDGRYLFLYNRYLDSDSIQENVV